MAVDKIEAVEATDNYSCVVHIQGNSYSSTFPYMTLLQLLEMQKPEDKIDTEQVNKTMTNLQGVLEGVGNFAG